MSDAKADAVADISVETQSKDVKISTEQLSGRLVSHNVRIQNRRTSVRLEPEMWDALQEVAMLQGCSIHDLCTAVDDLKPAGASFTGALRVFLMEYFRAIAKTNRQVSLVQERLHPQPVLPEARKAR